MSTDDFETRLRTRLVDLADREDDWDDPLPEARRRAALGDLDDAGAVITPLAPRRRRWLPGLAVAAVVLALVVGGGLGIRELARSSTDNSASAGSMAVGGDQAASEAASACAAPLATPCAVPRATGTQVPGPSGGTNGAASCPSGSDSRCYDTAGCEVGTQPPPGPLAGIASIRPSGITGSRVASGGTVAVPYQLTFTASAGTAQVRAARALWVSDGQVCAANTTATPGVVENVPVEPGGGTSGSATFLAVDSTGSPLPAGEYQVVIAIPYSVGGSGMSQLVSAPVSVVVS